MTSENFSRGQAFLAQGTDNFLNKMLSIRKVRLLITSRYIAMQSYECVIISKMFLIYFISYGCNGGALVFLRGAEASASPSFALPMFITIKKIIILHLFLGVPAATVGGTGTPVATPLYQSAHYQINQKSSVIFDDRLTFKDHIAKTARSCRSALHNIRKIRPFLAQHTAQILARPLSFLDWTIARHF